MPEAERRRSEIQRQLNFSNIPILSLFQRFYEIRDNYILRTTDLVRRSVKSYNPC
jgi:hypothetical protein